MAAVGPGPMLQIFAFCGWLEWNFHKVSALPAYKLLAVLLESWYVSTLLSVRNRQSSHDGM